MYREQYEEVANYMTVNLWKSYMWTADKEMNTEAIFTGINTT